MNPQRLLQIQQAANPSLRAAATPASLLQGGSVTPQFAGISPQGNNYNPQARQINYLTPVSAPYQLSGPVQVAHPQPLYVGNPMNPATSVIRQSGGTAGARGASPVGNWQDLLGGAGQGVLHGATGLVGGTASSVIRAPLVFSNAFANLGTSLAGGKGQSTEQQFSHTPGANQLNKAASVVRNAANIPLNDYNTIGQNKGFIGTDGTMTTKAGKVGERIGGDIVNVAALAAPTKDAVTLGSKVAKGGASLVRVAKGLFSSSEKKALEQAGIQVTEDSAGPASVASESVAPQNGVVPHPNPDITPAEIAANNEAAAKAGSLETPPTPAEAIPKEAGVPSPAESLPASAPKVPLTADQQKIIDEFPNGFTNKDAGVLKKQGYPDNIIAQMKQQVEDAHAAAGTTPEQAVAQAAEKNTAAPTEPQAQAETEKVSQAVEGNKIGVSGDEVYQNAKNAGVSDQLAGELKNVVDAHNTPVPKGATGGDVAKLAAGRLQEAKARAQALTNEIAKELSPAEQKELRALAEGEITADQASPAVRAVFEALKPVNDLAGDKLNVLHGSGTVEHYFPREATSGLKTPEGEKFTTGEPSVNTPGIQKAKDLFGIGDKPASSLGRSIYRFVGNDGTVVYGTPGSTGMSGLADGTFEKNGEIFKMEHAPQSEIEGSGVVKYNQNEAQVLGNYHGNVLASSSRHQLLENIKNSADVRPEAEALAGDVAIKNVPGLEKYVTTPETAKAIEASPLTRSAPKGPIGTVFNKASRFVIQSIVANPIFHGGNQEFNALFSAAWQMPGNKFRNIANIVKHQAEFVGDKEAFNAARTDYFNDGGHSPSYGKDYKGFISQGAAKVFGDGATKVTKVSANSMAAIEENIRVAAYQSARATGQTGAEAVKTIDRVLGGQDVVKDMESTTGLFLHYLKTNVKNIAKSGGEALQGNVAPLAGLALGYGAWFAANKALQAETGYTLRAPGAAGIINQFGKAPGQIAKGEIPGVVRNHINPLISFGAQAGTNRDFTKPITSSSNQIYGKNKNELGTVAGRTLFGPGAGVQGVMGGKQTAAQAGLAAGLGVYAPSKPSTNGSLFAGTNTAPPKNIDELRTQEAGKSASFINSLSKAEKSLYVDKNGKFIGQSDAQNLKDNNILNDEQYSHYLALHKVLEREQGKTKYSNFALDTAHAAGKIDDDQYNLTKAFEQSQANLTAEGKSNVAKRAPDATQKAIADYINVRKPPGLGDLQANPDLAKAFAKFTKDTATNAAKAPEDQETAIDYQDRTIKFWAQAAKDGAPANVQSVFRDGGNKAAMFLKQGKATPDDIDQAVALDNMLLASQIETTAKFSKKWRAANGYPAASDFMEGGAHFGTAGVGQYLSDGSNATVATGKGGKGGGGGRGFGNGGTTALSDGSGIFSSVNKKTGDVTLKNVQSLGASGMTSGEVDPLTGLFISKPTGIGKLMTKSTTFKAPGISLPSIGKTQASPKLKSFAAADVRGTPRPQRAVPIRFQRAKFK